MTRTTFLATALLTLLLLPGMHNARAQSAYVADVIEITLRTGPSNTHKILKMLTSDEPLEILEEQKDWLLVQTGKGDQGWVRKQYISQEVPKSIQIQQLTRRNEQLETLSGGAAGKMDALDKENSALKEALANIQKEFQQLGERYAGLESDAANVLTLRKEYAETEAKLKNATAELERFSLENKELREATYLKWFLSGAGVVFITWSLGFVMGRSRQRLQGSRLH